MDENENWIKVAAGMDEIEFKENNIACIQIDAKSICLIKTINGLKACSSKCPHAGGEISSGFLDKKGNIICPVHGYRFSLNNGRNREGEGYFLKIFQVKENEEGIFLEIK